MKEKTKTVLWNIAKALLIFICNSASYVFLVFNFVWSETLYYANGRSIDVSYWDAMSFKFKALVIGFMVVGAIVSYLFLKLFYKNFKEKENFKRQEKVESKKQETLEKTITKIMEGKK